MFDGERAEVAEHRAGQAVEDEDRHHHDVAVGGRGEQPPRLADAAQVGHRQQRKQHDRGRDGVVSQRRDRRGDRGGAGRDRHRDGEGVVDQQRRAGDETGGGAEVVLADDVGAAAVGVRGDRLAVAEHHDGQQQDHQQRDGTEVADRRHADDGHEDVQDLLGGERARRDGVGREDRQADGLGQPLMRRGRRLQRSADEQPLGRRVEARHQVTVDLTARASRWPSGEAQDALRR